MFVLCFEKGKFDTGFQTVLQTYRNLLNNEEKFWTNMIAVVTKVEWNVDYEDIENPLKTELKMIKSVNIDTSAPKYS